MKLFPTMLTPAAMLFAAMPFATAQEGQTTPAAVADTATGPAKMEQDTCCVLASALRRPPCRG